MPWSKLVSMELDDEAKLDACMPIPMSCRPDYPYGLRISLGADELKKLGLPVPDVGDAIDMRCFGTVTSVSTEEGSHGASCRVEIQIEKIAVENESTESPGED
jgi:hypothetical protein